MRIRDARAADAPAVARLEQELFGVDAWSEASVREELSGPRRRAVVGCAEDGTVVGYAVTLAAGDTVDLHRVAVAPAVRRTGLASRLLSALVAEATRAGAGSVLLEVSEANDGARAFYAAAGFEEIDRRRGYYRDGTDAVVLRLPLTSRRMTG